ncbi:DUF2851 family protein, partial [candidate division KSB1 bacterium]|nr:DUF2851 family protein [candidate division KSB1 bacterium]
MEIQDRSPIAEEIIFQLWEKGYFSSLNLKTTDDRQLLIISPGLKNFDSGPDFKNISIKIDDKIYQGDLEIHRTANDWYLHKHHHDSAYNDVILHLVIGEQTNEPPAIRLNQQPVVAQVFVDIAAQQMPFLTKTYKLVDKPQKKLLRCEISDLSPDNKALLIERAGLTRLMLKAARFKEERQQNSWDQIIYMGIMEALGYSKNQRPFCKLAKLLPIEAIIRKLKENQRNSLLKIQALLFGAAGLLPSQDPKLLIRDEEIISYVARLESQWDQIKKGIGIAPMSKEEWKFFRLRPTNFPTRRIAAISYILLRLEKFSLLDTLLKISTSLKDEPQQMIEELEAFFICTVEDFWATHYVLDDFVKSTLQPTLLGSDRARDICVNIVLPTMLAYAEESENGHLKTTIVERYQQYPKMAFNEIIRDMMQQLQITDPQIINTAQKQQ